MKTILSFLSFLCLIAVRAHTQNTFPPSGNVGIGTSTPGALLDISSPGDGADLLRFATDRPWVFRQQGSGATTSLVLKSLNADKLFIIKDDLDEDVFRIQSTSGSAFFKGNLGIGQLNTTTKLEVRESKSLAEINANNVVDVLKVNLSIQDGFVPGDTENRLVFDHQQWGSGGSRTFTAIGSAKEADAGGLYGGGRLVFYTLSGDPGGQTGPGMLERMRISREGNVSIGTSSADAKLTVKGNIHAEEVRVDLNVPGPDYVFEEDYDLPTLESLQNYIRENKHLPEVPSAEEMEANGIGLGVMNMLLLKKVEELTLYLIDQQQSNHTLRQEVEILKEAQNELLERIKSLENTSKQSLK